MMTVAIKGRECKERDRMVRKFLKNAAWVTMLCAGRLVAAQTDANNMRAVEPLSAASLSELKSAYGRLIDSENAGNVAAIQQLVWNSPSLLFVGKTPPDKVEAEGNWAGFWGEDALKELQGIVQSHFRIDPEYSRVRTVGISDEVAETYAPVQISVSFAGQNPTPRPFLQVVTWLKTAKGWKMATDIAIPIPASPAVSK
jgi:hypothetical protein